MTTNENSSLSTSTKLSDHEVEVKPGYKKTKIGWIPEEWEEHRLGEVCTTFKSGEGITSKEIDFDGRFPVYGGNGLRGYADKYTHSGEYFLIGRQGALCGNIVRITGKNYVSEHAIAVQTDENNNNYYLAYKLEYLNLNRLSESSAQPGLAVNKLLKYKVSFPPLKEQKKIAQILSTWDEGIAKQQQLIDRLKDRKKGLMQQLLTGSLRLRDASGEVFSGEWKEVKLGDVFEEVKDKNDGGKHEPLTISAKIGFVSQREKFDRVIAGGSLDKYTLIRKGEFSYNKGNSKTYPMGCIFLLEDYDSAVIPFVYISFRAKCTIANGFYKQWFSNHGLDRQLKAIITSGARGDGLLNVNKKDFFSLKIPFPSLEEQQTIAKVLTTADKEIALQERRLSELQAQKKGLMQQLLTGQKRVELN